MGGINSAITIHTSRFRRISRSLPNAFATLRTLAFVATITLWLFAAQTAHAEGPVRNAAHYYAQAYEILEALPADDLERIRSTADLQILALYAPPSSWSGKDPVTFTREIADDEHTAGTIARLDAALQLFHQGANAPECDWAFDFHSGNLSTPIPHLYLVTDLVQSALFRARYHWTTGNREAAAADVQALIHFAGHVGAQGEGGLISLVVQFNIERTIIQTLARWAVDGDSAAALAQVAMEPARPPTNLAKDALLLETRTVLPLAKRLIDTSGLTDEQRQQRYQADLLTDSLTVGQLVQRFDEPGLLDQIQQSHDHYLRVGQLLEAGVDEFQPQFDNYMRELRKSRNFFSDLGIVQCPGIERVYYDTRELHVRWRMLQTAIDIHQYGRKARKKHLDPYGDGPFDYKSSRVGFTLTSKLEVNGASVFMNFSSRS